MLISWWGSCRQHAQYMTAGLGRPSGPAPHEKESLPLDSFTRTALVAKLPKVNANLIATGALVYSFLQGKISCWQKHF